MDASEYESKMKVLFFDPALEEGKITAGTMQVEFAELVRMVCLKAAMGMLEGGFKEDKMYEVAKEFVRMKRNVYTLERKTYEVLISKMRELLRSGRNT